LLAALPVIIGSTLLALLYSDSELFRKLETLSLDFVMLSRAPTNNSDVAVVRITDDDYQKYFGGRSPLDPAQLYRIIEMIASAGPKVIAVDLDTSAETFQSFQVPPGWPPIIWARAATYSNVHGKYVLSGVLGRNPPIVPNGLVTLKRDSDGAIRRYVRYYNTTAGTSISLSLAVVKKFGGDESPLPASPDFEEEFLINYPGPAQSRYFIWWPVSMLEEISVKGKLVEDNFLRNKIVILGGDYAVQDEHDTPVGWMTGAQVLASIIDTERHGGGRKPIGRAVIVPLAIFDSVVLLLLIHWFGLGKTLIISLVAVPVLAVLLSLLLIGSVSHSGTFMLILIAVLAHQGYEKGKDYFKKWREQAAEEIK
jgi:CHASE2 domain-containing sensor protein